jgi:hypothetical protein
MEEKVKGLRDRLEQHWVVVLLLVAAVAVGTTWTVLNEVLVRPRDEEFARVQRRLEECNAKEQARLPVPDSEPSRLSSRESNTEEAPMQTPSRSATSVPEQAAATRDTSAGPGTSEPLPSPTRTRPEPVALQVDADPVHIDFQTKNLGQTPGCHCGNGEITFPGEFRGKAGEPLMFRYDGSEVCHGQGFENFEGAISWTGTLSAPLRTRDNSTYPGIAGTFKVTISQPGSYNVRATFSLDCVVGVKCRKRCSAQGVTTLVIR